MAKEVEKSVSDLYLYDVASDGCVVLDGDEELVGEQDVVAENELGRVVVLVQNGYDDLESRKNWFKPVCELGKISF
jgi:hypothetical protein